MSQNKIALNLDTFTYWCWFIFTCLQLCSDFRFAFICNSEQTCEQLRSDFMFAFARNTEHNCAFQLHDMFSHSLERIDCQYLTYLYFSIKINFCTIVVGYRIYVNNVPQWSFQLHDMFSLKWIDFQYLWVFTHSYWLVCLRCPMSSLHLYIIMCSNIHFYCTIFVHINDNVLFFNTHPYLLILIDLGAIVF